jgi:predicted ester cyclase
MSLEKNKAIIHSLYEAFNKQNLDALDDLIAPDYVDYSRQERGLKSVKHYYTDIYKGFSDIHLTIQDITAERDKVWVRFKANGTHNGEYHGLAPTGNKITVVGVEIYRIVNGKITGTEWVVEDTLDLYKQLGVIEYTEKAQKLFPEDVS